VLEDVFNLQPGYCCNMHTVYQYVLKVLFLYSLEVESRPNGVPSPITEFV